MPLADHPHRRTDAPRPATLRWGSLPVPSHHSAQPCWRRRCSSAPRWRALPLLSRSVAAVSKHLRALRPSQATVDVCNEVSNGGCV